MASDNKVPKLWLLLPLVAVLAAACAIAWWALRPPPAGETHTRTDPELGEVSVTFHGEVPNAHLFGRQGALTDEVQPSSAGGQDVGEFHQRRPAWLDFEYHINGESRRLLVAKQPLMNDVSWDAIARAGAATGDGTLVRVGDARYRQGAMIEGRDGHRYRVRLLGCGRSTMAPLSEWNLLIGGVHRGDMDFTGPDYGWLSRPYSDADLKVGLNGSLNWCREHWRPDEDLKVVRGYYFVSRFHATPRDFSGGRIYWRPVLERVTDGDERGASQATPWPAVSPDRRVRYGGRVSSEALFGDRQAFTERVALDNGVYVEGGAPDWLRFEHRGRTLLVAAKPIKRSVSWNDIARSGAVLGDGSSLRIDGERFAQDARVEDASGRRYRVRLLSCGESTMDHTSEWNRLIGGVHRGDGDFIASPDGLYGWLAEPLSDADLHLGTRRGAANWCQETQKIDGKTHGVNRGYLTVARYHATASYFDGYGFGWRPVLELIEQE